MSHRISSLETYSAVMKARAPSQETFAPGGMGETETGHVARVASRGLPEHSGARAHLALERVDPKDAR